MLRRASEGMMFFVVAMVHLEDGFIGAVQQLGVVIAYSLVLFLIIRMFFCDV